MMLNQQEQATITELIAQVEQQTDGEILVAVLARSAQYRGLRYGVILAGLALTSGLAIWWQPELLAHDLLLGQSCWGLLLGWLLNRSVVLRGLLTSKQRQRTVEKRARLLFQAHGVGRTQRRAGVLILISLLERRVCLLADVGLEGHVPAAVWQGHVATLTAALKQGQLFQALQTIVQAIGNILHQHLPNTLGNTQTIANQVITKGGE